MDLDNGDNQRILNQTPMQTALLLYRLESPRDGFRRGEWKEHEDKMYESIFNIIRDNMGDYLRNWLQSTLPEIQGDDENERRRFLEPSKENMRNFFEFYRLYDSQDFRKAMTFLEGVRADHAKLIRRARKAERLSKAKASMNGRPTAQTSDIEIRIQVKRESSPHAENVPAGKKPRTRTTSQYTAGAGKRLARKKRQYSKKKGPMLKVEPDLESPTGLDMSNLPSEPQPRGNIETASYIVIKHERNLGPTSHLNPAEPAPLSVLSASNMQEGTVFVLPPDVGCTDDKLEPILSVQRGLEDDMGIMYKNSPTMPPSSPHPANSHSLPFFPDSMFDSCYKFDPDESSNISAVEAETSIGVSSLAFLPVLSTSDTRPQLFRNPPIWAQTRQEVCESFEFFRSYQGGVYFSDNVVRGYLLSGFPAKRDAFEHDGRLIISHGGGGSASGQTNLGVDSDQLTGDKSVRALLNNYRNRIPLALLIDERYSKFPYSLASSGITYAVLGLYIISHAWAEIQPAPNAPNDRVVRWKFAFQWYPYQEDPWWIKTADKLNSTHQADDSQGHAISRALICPQCSQNSPVVYQECWLCLNPECPRFWHDESGSICMTQELTYVPTFLQLVNIPDQKVPPKYTDLRPRPPSPTSETLVSSVYEFSRGWHCLKCGRLTCRFKWQHWECGNCKDVLAVQHTIRKERDLRHIRIKFTGLLPGTLAKVGPASQILSSKTEMLMQKGDVVAYVQTYTLPENRGKIHHIIAKPLTKTSKEADEIFREYQEQAATGVIAFKRWPLRAHKCNVHRPYRYFLHSRASSSGEPYQYVGGSANTVPFSVAPSAVVRARDYMESLVKEVLPEDCTFNEVLSAAYMERQKMAFHSDAERGLGPVVAGVSFGSPAFMHFRLLKQYVPEGDHRENALSIILKHGDVLVMEGNDVQKYYEHCVSPANFRISATGRLITPSSASDSKVKNEQGLKKE